MLDLKPFANDPIVIITNEFRTRQPIENIELSGSYYLVLYEDSYYLARTLTPNDMEDEDFVSFVSGFWNGLDHIQDYATNHVKIKHYDN